ncbi:MAG: hypothetical protein R3D70_22560 [Rhizobiaceae bacterium]|jgi:hypothetical protein
MAPKKRSDCRGHLGANSEKFYFPKIGGHEVSARKQQKSNFSEFAPSEPLTGVDRIRQAGIYKGDMKRGLASLQQGKAAPAAIARFQQNCRLIAGVFRALLINAGAFRCRTAACVGRSRSPHRHLQHRGFGVCGGCTHSSSTAADNDLVRDCDTISVTVSGTLVSASAPRRQGVDQSRGHASTNGQVRRRGERPAMETKSLIDHAGCKIDRPPCLSQRRR